MKQYNSMYLGLCVNNQDPERRGRVQVFIPHIMPALYSNWNSAGEDIQINCVGNNIEGALAPDILETLINILPWAEAASPIIGTSAPGNLTTGGRELGAALGGMVGGAVGGAVGQAAGAAVGGAIGGFFDQGPSTSAPAQTSGGGGTNLTSTQAQVGDAAKLQKGGNPNIYILWNDIKPKYPGIYSDGIWGDQAHKARKSDHNTGDAIDIGHGRNIPLADSIVNDLIPNAAKYNIKYIIHNSKIWSSSKGWKPYNGANPHDKHIHVSFNRGYTGPAIASSAAPNPVVPQTQSDGMLQQNNQTAGASSASGDNSTEPSNTATQGLGGNFALGAPGTGTPAGTVSGKGTVSGGGTQVRNYDFKGKQNEAFAAIKAAAEKAGSPDPSLTASIASLEGGWLTSSMSRRANNPFGQTITPAQIGTNGIIGGTKGKDGQLHAVYDSLESAMAHHVKKWGKHYVAGDVNASTRNLVGASYNIEQGGGPWASSVQGIYAKRSGIPGVQVTGLEGMPPDASIANSSSATPPAVVEKTYGHGPVASKNTNDMPAGLFAYPSPGAMLWVFFREGNPLYPVYFAASYGQSEWSAAYRQGSPAPRMAFNGEGSNGGFSHGTVMNPIKGGPSLEFGTDYDGVDPSSDNSSFGIFNQNKSNLMIDNRLYQLYANSDRLDYTQDDSFETVMGYKESWVQGNSNQVVMGNQTIKIGNFSQQAIDAMQQLSDFSQQLNQTLMTNGGGGSPSIQATTNDTGLNKDAALPANLQKAINDQNIINKIAPEGKLDINKNLGSQVPAYLQANATEAEKAKFFADSKAIQDSRKGYVGEKYTSQQGTMTAGSQLPRTTTATKADFAGVNASKQQSFTPVGVSWGGWSSSSATNQTPPTLNVGTSSPLAPLRTDAQSGKQFDTGAERKAAEDRAKRNAARQ